MITNSLHERDFLFTVLCGKDEADLCPGGDLLKTFKQNIDELNIIRDRDTRRLKMRDIDNRLLELNYYGSRPEEMGDTYTRDVFTGLAKAQVFTLEDGRFFVKRTTDQENPSPGYEELQEMFKNIFRSADPGPDPAGNTFEWLIWMVVPLPDGAFDNFEFGSSGGEGSP